MTVKPAASATVNESLVNDPGFPWQGGCAYDAINRVLQEKGHPPLGPGSSRDELNKASFVLMSSGMPPDVRNAWNQIRKPSDRLTVDFFHYPVPDLRLETLDASTLERPMPVAEVDLLALADVRLELATPKVPQHVATKQVPLAGLVDFGLADLLPAPLCAAPPSLSDVIEVDDDEQ